jgi:hypothetical protein
MRYTRRHEQSTESRTAPGDLRRRVHATGVARLGALIPVLAVLVGGCSLSFGERVAGAPPGTTITKVSRASVSDSSPMGRVPTEDEIESSLRHISVAYKRGFGHTDPMRLLTEIQVAAYGPILAREFPTLKPGERLQLRFVDPYFGYPHMDDMEVRPQNGSIGYWFSAIAVTDYSSEGMEGAFYGELTESAPGQKVVNGQSSAYLNDPLSAAVRDVAATIAEEKRMLQSAQDEQVIAPEEAQRLDTLLSGQRPPLRAWKIFWEKRRVLQKALDLKLIDQDIYRSQLTRIAAELEQ